MPWVQKPLCLIHFGVNPFFSFPSPAASSLWGNRLLDSQYESKKLEISWNKINLTGCKWSNFNAPGIETPLSYILIPFFGLGKSEFVSLIRSSEHRNFESRNFSYLEVSITFCPTLRFPLWHNPFLPQWQTACSTVGTWALSNRGITNELIVAEQDQKFLTHNRAISKWQ